MVKQVLIGVGVVVVGAAAVYGIYVLVKYLKEQKEQNITPERTYSDELNLNEIKQWFSEKMTSENEVGVMFYPTEENLKKYDLNLDVSDSILIQMVYCKDTNEVVSYREIAFGEMSAKLKDLIDSNGGTLVIEKQ